MNIVRKNLIACFALLIAAASLYAGWQWWGSPERLLRIYDYETGELIRQEQVKVGDRLFFGWVHSWEKIPWHEYYHIEKDNSLVLDTIAYPAFGAGIPENKGKKCYIKDKMIYMDEIGQVFKQFDWINSHFATRDIKLNDELLMTGKDLPEHRRLILRIEERRLWNGG
ncbi:MAG: DUF1850 domain-containing protein [Selenomonadaceae bacterium]|nr:DUF1850 domain-containing protein [Selenomonadaceae bacterium]